MSKVTEHMANEGQEVLKRKERTVLSQPSSNTKTAVKKMRKNCMFSLIMDDGKTSSSSRKTFQQINSETERSYVLKTDMPGKPFRINKNCYDFSLAQGWTALVG